MRWLDDVSMDLRKMGINEWRDRARNPETWRHIVVEAKVHPGLYSHLEEEEDITEAGCMDWRWMELARDRDQWLV